MKPQLDVLNKKPALAGLFKQGTTKSIWEPSIGSNPTPRSVVDPINRPYSKK
jgi:hypothetical protein